jgi:hypothetical protein
MTAEAGITSPAVVAAFVIVVTVVSAFVLLEAVSLFPEFCVYTKPLTKSTIAAPIVIIVRFLLI